MTRIARFLVLALGVVWVLGLAGCGSGSTAGWISPVTTSAHPIAPPAKQGDAGLVFRAVIQQTPTASCAPSPSTTCSPDGRTKYLLGPVIIDGSQVVSATAAADPNSSGYVVNVTFNSAASRTWADYTSNNVGKQVAFVLDNQVLSAPEIQGAISGGDTQISGNFSQQQAEQLAARLSGR
ncbi:MAG TPA: hypothetical protein VG317_14245 [Pseudonocardiaceae bacterium]|nr:hypothetical protein [Pseudonocardiaceae bacterium]